MMKYLFETSINIFLQKRVHYLLVCGTVKERNQVLLVFMFLFTENIQKAFAELTSMLFCIGVSVFGPSLLFGCLYPVLSGLICLHSRCAGHRCIYGWESLCVYYVSVTVILEVGKIHWNILWVSIGNTFSLSFQQNKMIIVYVYGVRPLDIFRF